MTPEELKKAVDQVKSEGYDDEAILGAFYRMFQEGELKLEEFEGIVNELGYHLTKEFKNMSPEDQKTKGFEKTDEPQEGVTKKDIEEAKEVGPAEKGEGQAEKQPELEKKEDKPEDKPEDKVSEDKEPENSNSEDKDSEDKDSEDKEEEEAMKLFGR